jgi:hypothetical protein
MDQLDATQDHTGTVDGLDAKHRTHTALDRPMILLNTIVKVGTLADANGFQITPCSILESIGSIAGQDRLLVGLTVLSQIRFLLADTGEVALTGCCRINGLAPPP